MIKKKINIIFPYNSVGGAFRSTYEISNRLSSINYDVVVYFPFFPLMENYSISSIAGIKHFFTGVSRSLIRMNRVNWFNCRFKLKVVPSFSKFFIRDAQVIIANHWQTAFPVFHLPQSKGAKYYYIRDVEQWADYFHIEKECFKLNMNRLVTTKFIKDYLKNELGLDSCDVIRNGFNFKEFAVNKKNYSLNNCQISMIYSDHPMKGISDGIKSLLNIKQKYPNTRIVLFGFMPKPKDISFEFEYIRKPSKEILRNIYATSDIFLCPSLQEGWHNPPSEAMASKCAVVATNVGSVEFTIDHEKNGFKVKPADVDNLSRYIEILINDRDLRISISESAYKSIQKITWDKPISQLDSLFSG